ncbi:MAG: hypothetical protein WDZ35_10060 [Crocinitomicaceae bacterium]
MNDKVVGLIRTGGVITLFVIGVLLILNAMGSDATVDSETHMIVEDVDQVTSSVSYALYLIYACLGAIVIFTIWSIIQRPKRFIGTAIGIVVFGIIVLIGYGMASDALIPELVTGDNALEAATKGAHKWGGAAIKVTYILVALAGFLILVQSVRDMTKYFSK